jgi:hypothetical protein
MGCAFASEIRSSSHTDNLHFAVGMLCLPTCALVQFVLFIGGNAWSREFFEEWSHNKIVFTHSFPRFADS